MHTPMKLFKLILTFKYRSMILNLTATIHIANNVSKINAIRHRHACKNILLALVCSIVIDTSSDAFSTILVMVPVDAGFSGGCEPICSVRSTLVMHLAFRFGLS